MKVRPLTIGLASALILSIAANVFLLVSVIDSARGWADEISVSNHMNDERRALRSLALRVANGEPHRVAFDAVLRESSSDEPYEKDGWWGRYPLVARFDGERLSDVCWTVSYSNETGPCEPSAVETGQ